MHFNSVRRAFVGYYNPSWIKVSSLFFFISLKIINQLQWNKNWRNKQQTRKWIQVLDKQVQFHSMFKHPVSMYVCTIKWIECIWQLLFINSGSHWNWKNELLPQFSIATAEPIYCCLIPWKAIVKVLITVYFTLQKQKQKENEIRSTPL